MHHSVQLFFFPCGFWGLNSKQRQALLPLSQLTCSYGDRALRPPKVVVGDKQWEEEEAQEQEACLHPSLPHPQGCGTILQMANKHVLNTGRGNGWTTGLGRRMGVREKAC